MAHPAAVAKAMADSLTAPRAPDSPPDWLDEAQADAFRLLLHTLRTYGAALCAEPVGTGKTYIALAVARALGRESPACLVPAPLVPQWTATARRLGVPATIWSHSRLSLGRLPPAEPSLVILDESHHFRRPGIRRYRALAPWLPGRRVLLLSATPVVNGPSDLYHQLHLALRDDVLADDGAPCLRTAFGHGRVPPALGRFVVQRLSSASGPSRREREETVDSGAAGLLPGLDGLALSTDPGLAALLGCVLYRAAGSSAGALLAALRRYRHLLLHARDARSAGRPPVRRELRRWISGSEEQLLLWGVLPAAPGGEELCFDDLPRLDALIAQARQAAEHRDPKAVALDRLLQDGTPTLVFVTARETVAYLRQHLPDRWLAWCMGRRAGIGGTPMPRTDVLAWFRPGAGGAPGGLPGIPRTLITTDVASEGLDLQLAGRVVHYDLPWTEVRMTQRDGRAVRRGSGRSEVEIIRFLPGADMESRIHLKEAILRKSSLPSLHGLGLSGRWQWRWRREVSDAIPGVGVEGVAAVRSVAGGVLAGLALEGEGGRIVSSLLWRDEGGDWTDDSMAVEPRLREAAAGEAGPPPSWDQVCEAVASLSPHFKTLLRGASWHRIAGAGPRPAARRLGRRLRGLASHAARARDAHLLQLLERTLDFCTGGLTAGEAVLVERLGMLDDAELIARLPATPGPTPRPGPLRPRLTGLIYFRPPAP